MNRLLYQASDKNHLKLYRDGFPVVRFDPSHPVRTQHNASKLQW